MPQRSREAARAEAHGRHTQPGNGTGARSITPGPCVGHPLPHSHRSHGAGGADGGPGERPHGGHTAASPRPPVARFGSHTPVHGHRVFPHPLCSACGRSARTFLAPGGHVSSNPQPKPGSRHTCRLRSPGAEWARFTRLRARRHHRALTRTRHTGDATRDTTARTDACTTQRCAGSRGSGLHILGLFPGLGAASPTPARSPVLPSAPVPVSLSGRPPNAPVQSEPGPHGLL